MIITYKVSSPYPDPSVTIFEETLAFKDGFRHSKVPASIGHGTLTALEINPDFHINVQSYQLDVPLEVIKSYHDNVSDYIHIVFYRLRLPETAFISGTEILYGDEGINIYGQYIDAILRFPAHTERHVICMRISRSRLMAMLGCQQPQYVDTLLQPGSDFFIQEQQSPEMRSLLDELKLPPPTRALQQMFYHTKMMQLLYLLMERLNKRAFAPNRNGSAEHIARIFKARQMLVKDLSTPPTIASLARGVLLSESQLKQSFREMFGVSIYQYFQQARLEKARQMLAENRSTVKEVGYELGFTNIGHFSRLFERAFHVKPKQFQLGLPATDPADAA